MRKMIMTMILTTSLLVSGFGKLTAQTCSCAGAPILSSIEAGAAPVGSWLLGIGYEQHAINDVVDGRDELRNTVDRERYSRSLLIEASYGLTRNITLTGLLTMVRQERQVSSQSGLGEDIDASGIGGGLLLMKYTLIRQSPFSSRELSIGAGAKFPLGRTNVRNQGVLISEDMQPSSGSFDGILWGYAAQALTPDNLINLNISGSFRYSGDNDRNYDSGDEFITTFGLSHAQLGPLGGSAALRYRWSGTADRDDFDLPNTGGKWLYFVPGVSVQLPSAFSVQLSGQIPLYRSLEGVQFTTSYSWKLSLYRAI